MKARSSKVKRKGPISSPAYVMTGFANSGSSARIDRINDALDVWADGLPTIVALGVGYQGFQKLRHLLHEAVK